VDGEGLFVEDKEGIEQGGPQWFAGIKATGRKRKLWFSGDSARRKLPCTDGKVARSKGKVMSTIQGDLEKFHSSLDQLSVGLAGVHNRLLTQIDSLVEVIKQE